jgi:hypothetical protein
MNEGLKELQLQLLLLLLHSSGSDVMAVYLMNQGTSGLLTQGEYTRIMHKFVLVRNMVIFFINVDENKS